MSKTKLEVFGKFLVFSDELKCHPKILQQWAYSIFYLKPSTSLSSITTDCMFEGD